MSYDFGLSGVRAIAEKRVPVLKKRSDVSRLFVHLAKPVEEGLGVPVL